MKLNTSRLTLNEQNRISYIDSAKRVCAILVCALHSHLLYHNFLNLESLRLPLYFILAGVFFKDYGGFFATAVKKINKLLIPSVFFFLLAFAIKWLFLYAIGKTDDNLSLANYFTALVYPNSPSWFFQSLFVAQILYIPIYRVAKTNWGRFLASFAVGCLGYTLRQYEIFIPMHAEGALSAMPLIAVGNIIGQAGVLRKDNGTLSPNQYKWLERVCCAWLLIGTVLSFRICIPRNGFYVNNFYGLFPLGYILAPMTVMGALFMLKRIGRIPGIAYIGRYSIVFIGTHVLGLTYISPFLEMAGLEGGAYKWVLFIATTLLTTALIPIIVKLFPHLCAQKDLIHYNPKPSQSSSPSQFPNNVSELV